MPKFQNKRNLQRGLPEVEPIYTLEDAMNALEHFAPLEYETWMEPAKGIRARWWNAGHLLGSASIEVEVAQAGKPPTRILLLRRHRPRPQDAGARPGSANRL